MRRRWGVLYVLGLALAALVSGRQIHADAPTTARLTISVVGADMEFRTLGLPPAFSVLAGGSRVFRRLPPGTYVVAQAPPIGVATQVGPDEWTIEGGLTIQCSDGETHQHDLAAGDDVRCTYTAS